MDKYNERTKASSKQRYKYSELQRDNTGESTTDDEDAVHERKQLSSDLIDSNSVQYFNANSNRNGIGGKTRSKQIVVNGKTYYPYKIRNLSDIRTIRSFRKKCLFLVIVSLVILTQIGLALHYVEQIGIATIPGWDRNTTRDIPYYILPHLNTTLIEPAQICTATDNILVLIVVCSSAENFENRKIIRETWANSSDFNYPAFRKMHSNSRGKYLDINYKDWKFFTTGDLHPTEKTDEYSEEKSSDVDDDENRNNDPYQFDFSTKAVFLVGKTPNNETQSKLLNEGRMYGDILQESFLDSYNNLTLKTIMMLKWVNLKCTDKVKFLMKCDDDTFVNVPNLIHTLLGGTVPVYKATMPEYDEKSIKTLSSANRLTKTTDLLIGRKFCKSKPIGNTSSKWYSPSYMYDKKTYPNYLSGTGYVMSWDVAMKLYNASLITPLFHLEDVYLTGICAEAANVTPHNHQLFSYVTYKDLCEFRGMITKHEITSSDMKKAFEFITNTQEHCPLLEKNSKYRKLRPKLKYCN